MGITNDDIGTDFNNSILIDYLDSVIHNKPLKEVILKLSFKLQIFKEDGKTDSLEAIDKKQIEYIILATKLTTMVQVFNQLKQDDNFVMTTDMEMELNRFQDVISQSILKTNAELINK